MFAVQIANKESPPAGIDRDWLFEYEVPEPAANVSHLASVYPVREKPAPAESVTDAPVLPVVADTVPTPPFASYVMDCEATVHTA